MLAKVFKFIWPFLLLLAIVSAIYYFLPVSTGGVKVVGLEETKKIAIDTVIEVNKFVISTAFIIIGFFGSILIGQLTIKRNRSGDVFLFSSCVFALVAVFLGYHLYDTLIVHLNNSIADMENAYIQWVRRAQFGCILFSVLSFIIFVYYYSFKTTTLDEKDSEKQAD